MNNLNEVRKRDEELYCPQLKDLLRRSGLVLNSVNAFIAMARRSHYGLYNTMLNRYKSMLIRSVCRSLSFAPVLLLLSVPKKATGCLYDHLRWADVFVVVYSICDKYSLLVAEDYLEELSKMKMPSYYTTLLLANKRDLEHAR